MWLLSSYHKFALVPPLSVPPPSPLSSPFSPHPFFLSASLRSSSPRCLTDFTPPPPILLFPSVPSPPLPSPHFCPSSLRHTHTDALVRCSCRFFFSPPARLPSALTLPDVLAHPPPPPSPLCARPCRHALCVAPLSCGVVQMPMRVRATVDRRRPPFAVLFFSSSVFFIFSFGLKEHF